MLLKSEKRSYRADSIKILKGLEAVKKRPGMYIGDTDDGTGLHHMVYEVVDNSIDEALAGYCKNIKIEVNKDGTLSVLDDGRGIPADIHKGEKKSAAEVIMTQLHAGGKFDHSSYKVSGGLHGVGVSVVNALSQKLKLTIYRDKKEHYIEFKDGKAVSPLKVIGKTNKTGTLINFLPSKEIFSSTTFSSSIIQKRARELAYLNRGIRISIIDKTGSKTKEFVNKYDGGIDEFVEFLDNKKEKLLNKNENELFRKPISITGKKGDVIVESSIRWNAGYSEEVLAFTNNIFQKDGGTHLLGFRSALTRVINRYANDKNLGKKNTLYTYAFIFRKDYRKKSGFAKTLKKVYTNWAKKRNFIYISGHINKNNFKEKKYNSFPKSKLMSHFCIISFRKLLILLAFIGTLLKIKSGCFSNISGSSGIISATLGGSIIIFSN